ncbi:MAG: membrane protein insertase YidC [Bacteroidota bacterium]|nr:membrane protein insertase YidC [Bacteroidota bacterium]
MDKNTIIGVLLIVLVLVGYGILTSPSEKEKQEMRRMQDSIALAQKKMVQTAQAAAKSQKDTSKVNGGVAADTTKKGIHPELGAFGYAASGKEKFYTLENELIKVKISNKGGRVYSVELKRYKTDKKKPLILFNGDSSNFALNFFANNRSITTDKLFFKPYSYNLCKEENTSISGKDSLVLGMRLYADSIDQSKYIEFLYTLKEKSYNLGFRINFSNMNNVIAANINSMSFNWNQSLPSQEKSITNQRNASTIYYRFANEDIDNISETKDQENDLKTKVKWVAFKQQFFTSVLVADNSFNNAIVKTVTDKNSQTVVKDMYASIDFAYNPNTPKESFGMSFYFGPNHYQTLKSNHLSLEKQIPLGWGIFGWINRFAVIPVFNFLDGFNWNYGIIILILTILIKIVLFPIAYKTYVSSAKMRVLKPEIDEINAKFGKEDALKKQQATMALYKKAGVNPMAGCIPMLLQLPILIAMFRFFPSSIELRQQGFLWADDLSTYDSIYNFGFNIPFYGDHISLFTLLMTISTIIYTKMNNDMMSQSNQMPGMKFMMYFMPVMFLGIFNNYSAGLSYYYFLANIFTFGQQYFIRKFINEEKIHKQIQENKKRPASQKKSAFQAKLEEMAKQRGVKIK